MSKEKTIPLNDLEKMLNTLKENGHTPPEMTSPVLTKSEQKTLINMWNTYLKDKGSV